MLSQTSVQQAISQEFPTPFAAFHAEVDHHPSPLRQAITNAWCRDEKEAVQWLLRGYSPDAVSEQKIRVLARKLVESVREQRTHSSGVDALMHEYALSSEEGVALMCLAEALLRIPDHETANRLIADKIGKGDWVKHVGESPSMFVNAATWGLVITRKLVGTVSEAGLAHAIGRLIQKGGEPLVRKGVDLAIRMLGNQFVTGQTIDLSAFDFSIPICALDKTNHELATTPLRQVDQMVNHKRAAFLIRLNDKADTVEASQIRIECQFFHQLQGKLQPICFLRIDINTNIHLFGQQDQCFQPRQ